MSDNHLPTNISFSAQKCCTFIHGMVVKRTCHVRGKKSPPTVSDGLLELLEEVGYAKTRLLTKRMNEEIKWRVWLKEGRDGEKLEAY